jgi:hypothetical protein
MAAMVMVLVGPHQQAGEALSFSTFEDWFTWAVTFLPVLTGWLTVQHLLLPYTTMLALHILSRGNPAGGAALHQVVPRFHAVWITLQRQGQRPPV